MSPYQWILLTCNLLEGPVEKWLCLFSRTHPIFSQSSFIVGLCLLLIILYIFYLAEDSFCQCLLLLLLEQKNLAMDVSCVFPSLWLSFQINAVSNAYSFLFLYFLFFLQVAVPHALVQQICVLNQPGRNVPSKAALSRLLQLPINWCNWSLHWAQKSSKIWLR